MKTKSLNYLYITILLVVFSSCTKERVETAIEVPANNEMLVFNSMEDYSTAVKKTISFNHEELKVWEEQQGLTSYGRKCEEIYFSINFDEFNSFDEIQLEISKYSEYLVLIKNETDEYELEHFLYNNPLRYIINCDRMFQAGDDVYKVFENCIAYTNLKYINQLKQLNEADITNEYENSEITILNNNPTIISKDDANNCGSGEFTDRVTDGRDRTKLTIGAHQASGTPYSSVARCYYIVRPYKRTLGIWYWVSGRTMSASIKLALDYLDLSGWQRLIYTRDYQDVYASKLEGEGLAPVPQPNSNLFVHFGSYDCWATSKSTGDGNPAELQCGNIFVK
ncbi:MAG: hypothetical protein RBR68_13650 [Tenuifilaceae bacterium]|jgi:hypothetical protein|nr:hypothetical protein [Tenuifilaceae bacterium]